MEVEAEAESKATGEADVKAGLQRGANKVVFFVLIETIPCPPHPHYSLIQDSDAVQLDVTIKEKDAARMRPLHAETKSQDKYGLFSADFLPKEILEKVTDGALFCAFEFPFKVESFHITPPSDLLLPGF